MTITNIDLCARALTLLGADPIQSFDEGTVEAEVLGNLYTHIYQSLLTEKNWNFATKDASLNQIVDAPTDTNWLYQYQRPTDALKILDAEDQSWRSTKYMPEGDVILSNESVLNLKYIYNVDESNMPPWFVDYLVLKLAVMSCQAITAEYEIRDRLSAELKAARSNAYKQDELEAPQRDVLAQVRANIRAIRFGH